ncbi:hypothetical protein NVP1232O_25 [Vibrio phage 1.232.O._10N.261.51.E11]|nr:hypothetical protein NVP1232O_25 [Vibrio phage 1.232.O._10N.261.51.E11]
MGYEPRETTGGGSSESRESTEGNRETREREERGRDRDRDRHRGNGSSDTSTSTPDKSTDSGESGESGSQSRRSTNPTEVEDTRSFMSRIRDVFSSEDDDEPGLSEQMTDSSGEVVAESFTVDRPAEIQTVNLGAKTDYETIDSPNPVESYARSVIDSGLVGDEQKEKDLARDIADAGRVAQATDVASTFGSALAGPIGAVPGLVHGAVTAYQDDPVQKAGQSLYESGKVNAPGVSTAIGSVFGGIAGTAYDIANEVFGGSSQLGAFEEAAGIDRTQTSPNMANYGGSDERRSNLSQPTTSPVTQPTMASTFSMSSLEGNVYSDFLDNFFKQG